MSDVKFCKDCKFYDNKITGLMPVCRNPQRGFDLVEGTVKVFSCGTARVLDKDCSAAALWFEPKEAA